MGLALFGLTTFGYTAAASADALHVYGPAGDGTSRRVLLVAESDEGRCVDLRSLELVAAAPGTVAVDAPAGPCATWARLTHPDGEALTLLASGEGFEAYANVSVGAHRELALDVRTTAHTVEVTVHDARGPAHVVAVFDDGAREMVPTRTAGRYRVARQGADDGLVGVFAQADGAAGTALWSPGRGPAVVAFGAPIEAHGTGRASALLFMVDHRGRPTRSLPLHVGSEHGRLLGMRFVARGVAEVSFAVPPGEPSIDIEVSARGMETVRLDLPVEGGWPVGGTLAAPSDARAGATVTVRATVVDEEGAPLPGIAQVRCPSGRSVPVDDGLATCEDVAADPAARFVLLAAVHGGLVPLADLSIAVAAEPAAPPEIAVAPPAAAPAPSGPRFVWAAIVEGAVDVWAQPGGGVGVSLGAALDAQWRVQGTARYRITREAADGGQSVDASLRGRSHAAELTADVALRPMGAASAWWIWGALGTARTVANVEVGGTSAATTAWSGIGRLATGVGWTLGAWELAVAAGVRGEWQPAQLAWERAALAATLEVRVGAAR